ncbi:MAG: OmpA family protein [Chromatiales bacterium]
MYYPRAYEDFRRYDRIKRWVLGFLVFLLVPILWIGREQSIERQSAPQVAPAEALPAENVELVEQPVGQSVAIEPASAQAAPGLAMVLPPDGFTLHEDSMAVSGSAEPGTRVEISVNGQAAGQVSVGSDGSWQYDVALPAPGDYSIGARVIDAQGNEVASTPAIAVTRMPAIKPIVAPAIATPTGAGALAAGEVTFTGTGEPNREVVLVVDGEEIGRAGIEEDGKWNLTVRLEAAVHNVHGYTLDDLGNAFTSNSVRLRLEKAVTTHAADADSDGVDDSRDQCSDTAADIPVGADGCAQAAAAADADGDAVPDSEDRCPGTPSDVEVDRRGCPIRGETLLTLTGIQFDNEDAAIRADSTPILDEAVKVLRENSRVSVEIEGHTDDRGNEDYNLELSHKRAETVRQYLIDRGIAAERLKAIGRGEAQPVAANDSVEGRSRNRRVEFVVR